MMEPSRDVECVANHDAQFFPQPFACDRDLLTARRHRDRQAEGIA